MVRIWSSLIGIIALLLFAYLCTLPSVAQAKPPDTFFPEDGSKDTPAPFPQPEGPDLDYCTFSAGRFTRLTASNIRTESHSSALAQSMSSAGPTQAKK